MELTNADGTTAVKVTGEDYAEQQREAGANVVTASRTKRGRTADVGAPEYRSVERVYGPPNKQGTMEILFKVGDPIPEEEARRQGLITEPEATPEPEAEVTEPETEEVPEVQTEVQPEVQVEKPSAPKATKKTAAKRPPSEKE